MPENLKLAIDQLDAHLFQHTDYPRATLVALVLDYLDLNLGTAEIERIRSLRQMDAR
jgi:hypothetical protein